MEETLVKGCRDFYGREALKREAIRELLVKKFKAYGFMPAETPILEHESFVKASDGSEAVSTIFRLKDRGNRALALRYELTFQLKRLVKGKRLPFRRYQIGEVFRDEPIGAARFRQFTQCDVDVVGSTARDEAEILKLTDELLKELKIEAIIYINNRKLLDEVMHKQGIQEQVRTEVIKEIDKLDKLPEQQVRTNLEKYGAQKLLDIFKKPESYFKHYAAYREIQTLKDYCKFYDVAVKFLPSLARGLLYYNGSVFEVKAKKLKATIAGGGSYLVNGISSTGISFGLDRLSTLASIETAAVKAVIISIGQEQEAIKLVKALRQAGISCFIIDKLSKGLDYANKESIPYTVLIGKEELRKKKFKLRDMATGREQLLSLTELIKKLSSH